MLWYSDPVNQWWGFFCFFTKVIPPAVLRCTIYAVIGQNQLSDWTSAVIVTVSHLHRVGPAPCFLLGTKT